MKEKQETRNANVECVQNGRYYNLYLTIYTENGELKMLVNPLMKDKRSLSKLMYKVNCSVNGVSKDEKAK